MVRSLEISSDDNGWRERRSSVSHWTESIVMLHMTKRRKHRKLANRLLYLSVLPMRSRLDDMGGERSRSS